MAWATYWQQQGHTVTVITHTPNPQPDNSSYHILRQPTLWQQWQAMRRADVVLMLNISLKGLPLVWLAGKPLFISHHTLLTDGRYARQWRQQLKRFICNRFARLNICCSHYVARSLRRTVVVHSPYDAALFQPGSGERIPGSILFVGRLVSDKGIHTLLEAAARLQQQGLPFQLSIAGDGPLREELQAFSNSQQLIQIQWLGAIDQHQLVRLMQQYQMVVVPSLVEPFGTVVPEALACGCTVICSNSGGLPEAAGGFATLVPAGDAMALASAMKAAWLSPNKPITTAAMAAHLQGLTVPASADALLTAIQQHL
jgi:glycogen synthase